MLKKEFFLVIILCCIPLGMVYRTHSHVFSSEDSPSKTHAFNKGEIGRASNKLKVYIYDTSQFEPVELQNSHCEDMPSREVRLEHLIHKQFSKADYLITDYPEHADLFLVKHQYMCLSRILLHNRSSTMQEANEMTELMYVMPLLRDISQNEWFKRRNGSDHMFIHTGALASIPFSKEAREIFEKGIGIQHLGYGKEVSIEKLIHPRAFVKGKDIIIPNLRNIDIKTSTKELPKRNVVMFYSPSSYSDQYTNTEKKALEIAWNERQFHPKDFTYFTTYSTNYPKLLLQCQFSMCPPTQDSTSPWSDSVVDAIASGAIPVILSGNMIMPYQTFFDWTKFSVKLMQSQIVSAFELLNEQSMPSSSIHEKQVALGKVRNWMDWNSNVIAKKGHHNQTPGPFWMLLLELCNHPVVQRCHSYKISPSASQLEYYF
jgi:hypothetical protein